MSYINDALCKAQKDKKSPYAAYEPILSASGKKISRPRKWLLPAVILLCLLWAAGIIVFLNGSETLLFRPQKKIMTAATPLIVSNVSGVVPAKTQIAEKTAMVQKDAGLKTQTTPAEIKFKPEIAESKIIYEQAFKKQQEGNLNEARNLYRKVLKIDPQNIQALNNLGVIHMNTKYYKKAIMRFNDTLLIKHDYADAHYNLACLYAQKHNARQSLFYLKNAIHFNPQVRKWAANDADLKVLADLPEFKKMLEKNN